LEIETDVFATFINRDDILIIDIRESHEKPEVVWFSNVKQPFSRWQEDVPFFMQEKIVLLCQSGKRSLEAAIKLSEKYPHKKIYSLKGGILQWLKSFKNN
jgi:adenylyltransferase/sulfurtransferase